MSSLVDLARCWPLHSIEHVAARIGVRGVPQGPGGAAGPGSCGHRMKEAE